MGGFLLGLESMTGTPAYSVDVSQVGYSLVRCAPEETLVEPLRAYRAEFERRAGAR